MCNEKYPSITEAHEIFYDYIQRLDKFERNYPRESDSLHCMAVACNATLIASHCQMDGRKAYILGLLHDYGECYSRGSANAFHGTAGYDAMLDLGYPDIARICLTHTFPNQNFRVEDYNYPREQVIRTQDLICKLDYNDYDLLIQYCDALVTGYEVTSLKKRAVFILNKYKVPLPAIRRKYKEFLKLKRHFDKKCECDTYNLLGIENE